MTRAQDVNRKIVLSALVSISFLLCMGMFFQLVKSVGATTTWTVDDDGTADFSTIQEAINNAMDWDTVYVRSGVYYENVVVNKTVSLVGEDSSTTIIDGNGTGHVIDIISDNVNVTGFTVQRGGSIMFPDLDAGISLNSTTGCEISSNNIIDNGCFGIHLLNSDQNTISRNNLTRNTWYAIDLTTSSNNIISSNTAIFNPKTGIGMHASSQNNIVLENTMINNTYGIDAASVRNNAISGNYLANNSEIGIWIQDDAISNAIYGNNVTDSRYCIKIEEQANSNTVWRNTIINSKLVIDYFGISIENWSVNNTVFGNNIITAWGGVHIYRSNNNSVSGNNITNTLGGIGVHGSSNYNYISGNNITNSTYGFIFHDADYNSIHGNNITACEIAIWLQDRTNYNTILRNNIANNDYGIQLEYARTNTFYHNNFVDNTFHTSIIGYNYANSWDAEYPSSGNYWDDYVDVDQFSGPYQNETGSDGIWDHPYVIDQINTDHYPLVEPWILGFLDTDLNQDGIVNIYDLYIIAKAFGSHGPDIPNPGDPSSENWNATADLNKDNWVNIWDLYEVARDYGKTV